MIVSWSLWCDFLGAGGRSGTGSPPFAGFGESVPELFCRAGEKNQPVGK